MTDAVRSGQRCRLLAMAAVVQHAAGFLPTPSFSPLPLPALAKSVTPLQIAGPFRKTRCCPRSVIRMADDEPIPEAIVEAEAKATPMRPVRQQAYVLLGAISLIVGGGLAASKQGGVAAADSLAASVPILVSPEITEALCAVVAVGCLYFLYAEEQTKQENLKRILARFEEKKTKIVGSNRDDRRMKEKEAKMQQKQAQRDRKRAAGGTEAPVSVPKSPSVDSGVAQGENEKKEGLLDKVQQSSFKSAWMNDINEVSRSQAMQLNKKLEDAGVIPKIAQDKSAAKDPAASEKQTPPAENMSTVATKASGKKKKGKKKKK